MIKGGYVEALYMFINPGDTKENILPICYAALDRPGQNWVYTGKDRFGWDEAATNDGRLYAKIFLWNGRPLLRVCYRGHLTNLGLLREPVQAKARTKSKSQPRELLPPVEERS
jgi:hypothetical protein